MRGGCQLEPPLTAIAQPCDAHPATLRTPFSDVLPTRFPPPLAPSPMSTSGACDGGPKAEIAMVDDDDETHVSGSEAQRHGWPCSAPPLARRPSGERLQLRLLDERLQTQAGAAASLQVAHLQVAEFQHRGLPHAHIHTFILGKPQALPALPYDVLRIIWQAKWRTEAAVVIQQIWRDGADRRRRRRVNTRNIMRACGRHEILFDAYEEHIHVERVQSILYLIKYMHKGERPDWFITL